MIAERIYNGETAEEIGISQAAYESRLEVVHRFMAQRAGVFSKAEYAAWLQSDTAGDPGPGWQPDQASRGLGDTIAKITSAVGIKPCGGCKQRQKKMNKLMPYKTGPSTETETRV